MSPQIERIERQLTEKYGPLLTKKQLADLLHRSNKGLDYTLSHPTESDFAASLYRMKLRLGRLIYFRSIDIATLLAGEESPDAH
ncbi:hypothetical protein M2401_005534 [Pseudomonas sp. JUb42]|uniref:hypothetical protein n=1 Tax=Pseudomonas sp. JUb42 TaxID=2940611 RepID=UPI0021685FA4|nr:hypothetical protein [Pseudomonas sp. JUb42]MCS3471770.1 hypothetical protein [Pseudomonas sp. JUb42]